MDFSKIVKDITNEYVKINDNKSLTIKDMNIVNSILFDYINSYYFKDLYHAVHMRETEDGYRIPCLLKNKNRSTDIIDINGNEINIKDLKDFNLLDPSTLTYFDVQKIDKDLLFDEIRLEKTSVRNLMLSEFIDNNEIKNTIKNKLKEQSDFYSVVFENNPIKMMLNTKNKKEINISRIDCHGLSQKEIHQKISAFNNSPDKSTVRLLTDNYALKYLHTIRHAKSIYIAHNDFEIAGFLSTDINYHLRDVCVKDYLKFDYIEAIAISKSFNGLNLGARLYERLIEDKSLDNGIILMSRYTDDGANHLEKKFNDINEKYPNVVIIQNDEKDNYAYKLIEILFNNENKTFYHFDKDENMPQIERKFEDSLSILNEKLKVFRNLNNKQIEEEIRNIADSSTLKKKLKIKPQ